jgi:Pyridoxamine 5'-phosphate oxidase
MMPNQGDLSLLQEPIAQELLHSAVPARLAYVWKDGTPRVIPIWFYWTGNEILMVSPPVAPKMAVLKEGTKVALAIDFEAPPIRSLSIRGTLHTRIVDGEIPEYADMVRKYLGDGTDEWRATYNQLVPRAYRLAVTPEWVGIIDLAGGRFPSALASAMS